MWELLLQLMGLGYELFGAALLGPEVFRCMEFGLSLFGIAGFLGMLTRWFG